MPEALLVAVPILPLVLAAALALPWLRGIAAAAVPLAALPAVAAALTVPVPVAYAEPWLLLGAHAGLTETGRVFLLFTGVLWLLAGFAASAGTPADPGRTGFLACFLLAMSGNLGLLVALDVFSFYAFFAVMSFASYGLVIHGRTQANIFAARVYIAFVVAGELALFAGLALAAQTAETTLLAELRTAELSTAALVLLILGLGVKLGAAPLHLWLPLAHTAAPAPASAVLSGTMIKAGLFGMLAVLPLGLRALPEFGMALICAGMLSVALAAVIGVTQRNPKTVLAYSSVGQMGVVAAAIGAGLLVPEAWPLLGPALVLLAAHHALAKGALFLGVGAFAAAPRGRRRSLVALALAVPALALAGAPWTSGSAAKAALADGLALVPTGWGTALGGALILGSLATTLLMLRFAWVLPAYAPNAAPAGAAARRTLPALAATALSAGLLAVWPFALPAVPAIDPVKAALPVLGGLALGAGVAGALRLGRIRIGEIPAAEGLALVSRDTDTQATRMPLAIRGPRWRPQRPRPVWPRLPADPWPLGGAAALALLLAMALIETARYLP